MPNERGSAVVGGGVRGLYDRGEAARFIQILTGNADAPVWWATFRDGEGESSLPPRNLFGSLGDAYALLVEASEAGHGIFVTVNETDGAGRRTENITRVRALFADEDEKDGRYPVAAGQLSPAPSMVVRSGGGRHFYWVARNVPPDVFTAAQKGIAARLGTDPKVSDLARVMRCPGFPHQKDRSNPKPVFIEGSTGDRYEFSAILAGLGVDLARDAVPAPILLRSRVLSGDQVERARAYISSIPAVEGEGGDLQTFKVCAVLLWDFALEAGTAWDLAKEWNGTNAFPPWKEEDLRKKFESARRNGKHERGAALNALTAANEPASTGAGDASEVLPEVAALNHEWFVLDEGGKLFVCRFIEDAFPNNQRRRRLVRYSFPDFKKKHENRIVGRQALGDAWLAWPGRRQYDRAVFDPTGRTTDEGVLNLWTGWAIPPAPGDWSLLRTHIVDVVCRGNKEHAEYLVKWIARLFQQPSEAGFVVPVLRGKEGVGKSVLGLVIRRALGQYGLAVSNPQHVVGNFNAHLRDLLFLEASEAFFAGDKAQANQLKALITDDMLVIEAKGVDAITVPNMLHVFMTTNEAWAVSAGPESRRYFVLDVSDARRNDAAYFKALFGQVKDDGAIAAMLYDLLALDLSDFNVRKIPITEALLDQRERSLTGVLAWAVDLAVREEVDTTGGRRRWRAFFATSELYEDFCAWVGRNRFERGISRVSFGRALKAELSLEQKRACPRSLVEALPLELRDAQGYMVGTVAEFRTRARRAAGLEGQGSGIDQGSGIAREIPEEGNPHPERVLQGSQGSQGCLEEVAGEEAQAALPGLAGNSR